MSDVSLSFSAYDLSDAAKLLYPKMSKTTPLPVAWWNIARGGWRQDGKHVQSGWSLKRREAQLHQRRICHYYEGDVHSNGKLHCFCPAGDRCKPGQEYDRIVRVAGRTRPYLLPTR